jgi:hypothetical protein
MRIILGVLATAALSAALAVPTSASADARALFAADCQDAHSGETCIKWCYTNPGGSGGVHPCGIENLPKATRD